MICGLEPNAVKVARSVPRGERLERVGPTRYMYTVGLDVDTIVSLILVIILIIIGLFAGNLFYTNGSIYNLLKEKIRMVIFYLNLYFLFSNIGFKCKNKNEGESAGNLEVLFKANKNLNFYFDGEISKDLFISDHLKKHHKPESEEEFGHYLAGLIEGDGHIRVGEINIVFNKDDIFLAYYLKKKIGYGSVLQSANQHAVYYAVFKKEGRKKVLELINGKLRGPYKIKQFLDCNYDTEFNLTILPPSKENILNNY